MAYMKITTPYTGIHDIKFIIIILWYNAVISFCSDCLRFCFLKLLQEELDKIAIEWNYHVIRRSRMAECPGGIPDQLYFIPQLQGIIYTAITLPWEFIIVVLYMVYIMYPECGIMEYSPYTLENHKPSLA